ncbi:hypothetical protein [Pseudomonas sp. G5(2012)]|uniref:hypothetical protein n=1 Tax=Pseudomonas sp. G5(2012) TaxID=1268068 RepID=UPI00352400FD
MQSVKDGNQSPVDAVFTAGGIFQPVFAVVQFANFREGRAHTGHIVGKVTILFGLSALKRGMEQLGDVARVIILGVVVVIVICAIEKQADVQTVATTEKL